MTNTFLKAYQDKLDEIAVALMKGEIEIKTVDYSYGFKQSEIEVEGIIKSTGTKISFTIRG